MHIHIYYTAWTYIHSYTHVCIRHDLVCIHIWLCIYMYTCLHIISSIYFLFSEYSIYLGSYHLNMYVVFYSSISYLQGRHAFFGKPLSGLSSRGSTSNSQEPGLVAARGAGAETLGGLVRSEDTKKATRRNDFCYIYICKDTIYDIWYTSCCSDDFCLVLLPKNNPSGYSSNMILVS